MTKRAILVAGALAALALGFAAGRITGPDGGSAHAQPRGKRLISIAVENGAVFKAYDDETVTVCTPTPAGVSCRPFQ